MTKGFSTTESAKFAGQKSKTPAAKKRIQGRAAMAKRWAGHEPASAAAEPTKMELLEAENATLRQRLNEWEKREAELKKREDEQDGRDDELEERFARYWEGEQDFHRLWTEEMGALDRR